MSDLINRQAALDALEWKWAGKAALDAIKALPSAQPEPQWIPVSERLPKTDKWRTWFIVTTEHGFTTVMEWENTTIRGRDVSRWIHLDRISPFEVVAWMPLPEPYKEGEG